MSRDNIMWSHCSPGRDIHKYLAWERIEYRQVSQHLPENKGQLTCKYTMYSCGLSRVKVFWFAANIYKQEILKLSLNKLLNMNVVPRSTMNTNGGTED